MLNVSYQSMSSGFPDAAQRRERDPYQLGLEYGFKENLNYRRA